MWVYRVITMENDEGEVTHRTYQTGYYFGPSDDFFVDLRFTTLEEASERVNYLNGGAKPGVAMTFGESKPAFEPPF
jgi:hypothetical protein